MMIKPLSDTSGCIVRHKHHLIDIYVCSILKWQQLNNMIKLLQAVHCIRSTWLQSC